MDTQGKERSLSSLQEKLYMENVVLNIKKKKKLSLFQASFAIV